MKTDEQFEEVVINEPFEDAADELEAVLNDHAKAAEEDEKKAPEPNHADPETGPENAPKEAGNGTPKASDLMTGKNATAFLDIFMSRTISAAAKYGFDTDIPVNNLKLDNDEKRQLEGVFDEWLKTVNFEMTPGYVLLLSLVIIYGGKFIEMEFNERPDKPGRKTTPDQGKKTGPPDNRGKVYKCSYCGEEGHTKRSCKKYKEDKKTGKL